MCIIEELFLCGGDKRAWRQGNESSSMVFTSRERRRALGHFRMYSYKLCPQLGMRVSRLMSGWVVRTLTEIRKP